MRLVVLILTFAALCAAFALAGCAVNHNPPPQHWDAYRVDKAGRFHPVTFAR